MNDVLDLPCVIIFHVAPWRCFLLGLVPANSQPCLSIVAVRNILQENTRQIVEKNVSKNCLSHAVHRYRFFTIFRLVFQYIFLRFLEIFLFIDVVLSYCRTQGYRKLFFLNRIHDTLKIHWIFIFSIFISSRYTYPEH